jgi:hypothetical protein
MAESVQLSGHQLSAVALARERFGRQEKGSDLENFRVEIIDRGEEYEVIFIPKQHRAQRTRASRFAAAQQFTVERFIIL